jgi:hypothetical protein
VEDHECEERLSAGVALRLASCPTDEFASTWESNLRKGTPVARPVRKATGLPTKVETAGFPKGRQTGDDVPVTF